MSRYLVSDNLYTMYSQSKLIKVEIVRGLQEQVSKITLAQRFTAFRERL